MSDALEQILKAKKPQQNTTHVLLNPGLEKDRDVLLERLARAEKYDKWHNDRDTAIPIQEAIEELESKIADERQPFVFQAIGRKAYSALLDEYKPRDGNTEDKDLGFNTDEFPTHLIALSAHDPGITLEQARKIWDGDDWSDAETTLLLTAAVLANKEIVDVPFTNDGLPMGTRSTASPSNTVTTEDSPTQSS